MATRKPIDLSEASEYTGGMLRLSWFGVVVIAASMCQGLAQGQDQRTSDQPQAAVGDMVTGIYALVSSTGGTLPDWEKVRACFLKESVIVLRTSATKVSVFSLDGFIKDFVDFYERPLKRGETTILPKVSGFTERVVRMKVWEYGEMAHVLVLYEAHLPGSSVRPQQGVDSWLLVRREGRWLVAAVTNEVVTAARPIPPELTN